MPRLRSTFPPVAPICGALLLLLSGCTGSRLDEWTDHGRHLSDGDMASLRFSYALCEKASLDAGVDAADLHVQREPLLTDTDLVLGATMPGYWSGKGAWWLGRGVARTTIIATERPDAFSTCMRNLGWWHEEDFVTSVQ